MATYYAVGATYNGTTNSLSTSSGGSATVAVVTSADTIIFDGNSISLAFTADPACALINIESAFTHTVTLSLPISAGEFELGGGTFHTGGNAITLTGTSGTVWSFTSADYDSLSLIVSDTGSSSKTLAMATGIYDLSIASGGSGIIILNGTAVNILYFTVTGASTKTIEFEASETFEISAPVTFDTGALVTLKSTSSGTAATINLEAGWTTDYVSVQDLNAVGETPGVLGYHGVIGTNATGWVLVDSPLALPIFPPVTPGASQFSALVGKSVG